MVLKRIVGMLGIVKKKPIKKDIARTLIITKPKKLRDLGSLLTGVLDDGNGILSRIELGPEEVEEKEIFETMYDSINKNFPYKCTKCGRKYENESEYTFNTEELPGFTDGTDYGRGLLFMRNCVCGTSICLDVDYKKWDAVSQGRFKRYFGEKTTRKIRKLEREAILAALNTASFSSPTKLLVQKTLEGIDHEKIKKQVWETIRARYNAYLSEREHH